jgi:NAD+ diphosphatase
MLVESPDGQRALLGRSVRSTPGMYTCLSGFIDQCEGIEEAVRREVWEEALISVSTPAVLRKAACGSCGSWLCVVPGL